MEEMTIWEQHTVTLNKDPKYGFGVAISGGRDKPNPANGDTAVVISDVVSGGPAMGKLQTRDQIVMVNGVSMENTTSQYTIQQLKSCGKAANVTVKRPRTIQVPASNRPTRSSSQSNLLDSNQYDQKPGRGSDSGYSRRPRSITPERNGHDLALMSGFKRLPNRDTMDKPVRATLVKKKPTDEYGMKLGSQIFIKHMTPTGLAAKEGTLQEGDLVLKINGMTTENLSLLETKHLVEKSRGKLTMLVLRDERRFLVNIPEVEDSPRNSADERRRESSSELEEISDLDSDTANRTSRPTNRERRTRRHRTDAPPSSKVRDSPPSRTSRQQPAAQSMPRRRVSSESESDRSNSPAPAKPDSNDNRDRYRVLTGVSALPNPRASPVPYNFNAPRSSSSLPRPRKAISESDSDRSASPVPRRESPRTDVNTRYKVLPDLPQGGLNPSARSRSLDLLHNNPYRPSPRDESESDRSSGPARRQGTMSSLDIRDRYRATPEVDTSPMVSPPKWSKPSTPIRRGPSESGSDASYPSVPRPDQSRGQEFVPEAHAPSVKNRPELRYGAPSPARSNDPAVVERAPSTPRRSRSSTDHDSNQSFPQADATLVSDILRSNHTRVKTKPEEEPLYSLPPDADFEPNLGYSSDQHTVGFIKEGNVGLRLVGGNDVGIFVGGIQPNSPAQKQGMKEGDQILQVNGVDFTHMTREEAAMFLMNIRSGDRINMLTQNKMDIYKKILKSGLGDSFYIRTHFDHEEEETRGLSFTRGEVFRVLDSMYRGKLGTWLAVRMGNDLYELDKGTIPNQTRAETLASTERIQRIQSAERQSSAPRAEFWKLRGLRGAKKPVRRTRDDLLQLTIQGKFPAYEKVVLREANFKRPVVIMGPLNDIANEKLAKEMPNNYEVAEMVARSGADEAPSVIKLDTVKRIAEKDKHPLLDITPTAVERLSYIQYHPIVLFLEPHSRKDVKAMRQRYDPTSKKSSRKLYAQALKLKKNYSHIFAAHIDLQPTSNVWYEILKEKVQQNQSKPVWVSEMTLEGGADEDLDAFNNADASDYLSGASDYEDTDGEPYTDGETYTDTEDLDEAIPSQPAIIRRPSAALARSSEPATQQRLSPDPELYPQDEEEEPEYILPPQDMPSIRYTPEPQYHQLEEAPSPVQRSFSDSEFHTDPAPSVTPSEGPPDFRAPDPYALTPESPPPVTLSVIEQKLQQTRKAESSKPAPSYVVLAHHEAMLMRRTQIRGSDSSDDDRQFSDDDNEEDTDDWGPATEL
ncbi:tight junction protein ZO-3 isoform X2 [Trichomycterus rosablanca]